MKGKIFNEQEVQAIIAGTKTMFREVIKAQPNSEINPVYLKECNSWQWATKESRRECPYQVGQKIFVKESFDYREHYSIGNYDHYTAWKKRPAQHMKQEQSRITLEITSIKVERLADISEEDCEKEGVDCTGGWNGEDYDDGEYYFGKLIESEEGIIENTTEMSQFCDRFACKNEMFEYAEDAFEAYWNSTHKKQEHKWEANPWVWVVDFKINK